MSEERSPPGRDGNVDDSPKDGSETNHTSLKYSLLGPSLTKAGQEAVDQSVVSEIIYNASKGSKFFNREEEKDKILTAKIERILSKKQKLEQLDLTRELRAADNLLAQLELSRDLTQQIVHVDCDAFYASVELLDRPELEDLPFAVGGGILTTCNYVARKFGCRSGMPGFVAKKLCPQLVLLPLNFDKYNSKAAEIREILVEYDPRFESASIDEAYLNITEYCARQGMEPAAVVSKMRQEVHEKTRITISAGIAANTRIAKICSNMNKPNGQFSVPHDRTAIMDFMAGLSCRKVNGIGRVLERELASVGINTCGDIFSHRQYLQQLFGDKTYEFLLRCYLGLGRTSVQPAVEYERKSVGTESTFREMSDPVQLREKLRRTADELEKDMRRAECKGRTLCLKVKLHTFEVLTRQVVPPKAVFLADDLYNYSLPMLVKLEQEFPSLRLRLLGLRCTQLVSTKPPDTATFFGLRPRAPGADDTAMRDQRADGGDEWEQWPDDNLPGHDVGSGDTPPPGQNSDAEAEGYRRHGKEITANPQKDGSVERELWDCPICGRPQAADERRFNEHIDLCLSRQAIRDTVQQEGAALSVAATTTTPPPSVDKKSKKRTRPSAEADPRQTKLRFG
ncbi:DNA/RNA polymerase [Podospora conica]|nr:DNA/RNA polymerase [Schizothecium conicum]